MPERPASTPSGNCSALSNVSGAGVFKCSLPKGHRGPHKSGIATWDDNAKR